MDGSYFWQMIDWAVAQQPDMAERIALIEQNLPTLTSDQLVGVQRSLKNVISAMDTEGHLEAMVVLHGRPIDASEFWWTLAWVVLCGSQAVREVTANPDALAAWYTPRDDVDIVGGQVLHMVEVAWDKREDTEDHFDEEHEDLLIGLDTEPRGERRRFDLDELNPRYLRCATVAAQTQRERPARRGGLGRLFGRGN